MTTGKKYTVNGTLKAIRALGLTCGWSGSHVGEFRVNAPKSAGGTEATAYYTNDARDAILTAEYMVQTFGLRRVNDK